MLTCVRHLNSPKSPCRISLCHMLVDTGITRTEMLKVTVVFYQTRQSFFFFLLQESLVLVGKKTYSTFHNINIESFPKSKLHLPLFNALGVKSYKFIHVEIDFRNYLLTGVPHLIMLMLLTGYPTATDAPPKNGGTYRRSVVRSPAPASVC